MAEQKCVTCAHRHWRHETRAEKVGAYCAATGESERDGDDRADCPRYLNAVEAKTWKPRT